LSGDPQKRLFENLTKLFCVASPALLPGFAHFHGPSLPSASDISQFLFEYDNLPFRNVKLMHGGNILFFQLTVIGRDG
jgi:hypothetical protein